MIGLKIVSRLLAFVNKELVEVVRRPGAIVSLILGPFLIMALFGFGYQGYRRPLATIIVIPPDSGLPTDVEIYRAVAEGMEIVEISPEPAGPLARLDRREVDTVIVAPSNAAEQFRAGQQSVIEVHINVIDPVQQAYAGVLAARMASDVNARLIQAAAEEGSSYALEAGADALQIPPAVVAEPTRADLENDAPVTPGIVSFYGPAVLALIIQHLAVTLVALSLVRERTSGLIELFRISPIATWELIVGKLLAFGILAAAVSTVTVGLLLAAFQVPVLGDPLSIVGVVGLLTLASLALGLFVAMISDSERQAVQLSLLILLASVFFSGFVMPIEEFTAPVRAVGYALPVTHGIRLLQDLMLRGWTNAGWQILALGTIAAVLLLGTWLLVRREMARA